MHTVKYIIVAILYSLSAFAIDRQLDVPHMANLPQSTFTVVDGTQTDRAGYGTIGNMTFFTQNKSVKLKPGRLTVLSGQSITQSIFTINNAGQTLRAGFGTIGLFPYDQPIQRQDSAGSSGGFVFAVGP